jgi:hypothetical protein
MEENLKIKLTLLKEKENHLKEIIERAFSSEKEFNSFVEDNKEVFMELKSIKKEIKEIEWQLMTDEERETHLQYLKNIKDKFREEE